jgi:hypothetical protein
MPRRRFSPEGVEVVEPGNGDVAAQLRQVFDVAQRFAVDLSQTVVPVVIVDKPRGSLSVTPAEAAYMIAYAVNAPGIGLFPFVSVENQSIDRIVTVEQLLCRGARTMLILPARPAGAALPVSVESGNGVGSFTALALDPREGVVGSAAGYAASSAAIPAGALPFWSFDSGVPTKVDIAIPPGFGLYVWAYANQVADIEARGRILRK